MNKLHLIPVSEFLTHTSKEIEWFWEPFIPAGSLTLFAAYMKVGKSTLTYSLLAAIAKGEPFLGYKTKKTAIALLAVEEHPRDVAIRLEKFQVSKEDPIFVHSNMVIPNADFYTELEKFVIENKIGVVIVDTLSKFWVVLDENDNAEVQRAVNPLLNLARKTNAAVIMIHHANKGDGSGGKIIRGASSLFGIVDQALILSRHGDSDSNQRKLETLGRYDDSPREIIVALEGDSFTLIGSAEEAKLDALREILKGHLSSTPKSAVELAKELKVPAKKILKALTPLPSWVLRTGAGRKADPFLFSLNTGQVQPFEQFGIVLPGQPLLP